MGRSSSRAKRAAAILSGPEVQIGRRSPLPKMISVDSSYIKEIGYKKKNNQLFLRFKSKNPKKQVGYYDSVPEEIFQDMLHAKSKGIFQKKYLGPNYRWHYLKEN